MDTLVIHFNRNNTKVVEGMFAFCDFHFCPVFHVGGNFNLSNCYRMDKFS